MVGAFAVGFAAARAGGKPHNPIDSDPGSVGSLLLQRPPVETMVHAAGLSIAAWVVLSDLYRVRTRPDEECDRLLHAYQLDGVHRGYIGGLLLEKFYNQGWVDYVLLVLTFPAHAE